MRRQSLDRLVSILGLSLAALLIVAGSLLAWAHNFVGTEVHNQLAAQQIFFPAKNSPATAGAEFAPMRQYAGQQLTTGAQAETYADHFIAVHLKEIGGGKTYAQLSSQAQADPSNTKLAGTVETMFKGETLRGTAAQRLRLRHHGHHRGHRRANRLHRRRCDAAARRPRPVAQPPTTTHHENSPPRSNPPQASRHIIRQPATQQRPAAQQRPTARRRTDDSPRGKPAHRNHIPPPTQHLTGHLPFHPNRPHYITDDTAPLRASSLN